MASCHKPRVGSQILNITLLDAADLKVRFNDHEVLKAASLTIRDGDHLGMVGRNGCGKTTLLKMMQGLYAPTSGRVLLDGGDTAQFSRRDLASWIGYVPQEWFLFAGTIRETIAIANPDADEDDIVKAAKLAGVHDYVIDLPDGYATVIGEAGSRLSGGQRQRVMIAMALANEPGLLIADEPTTAVDVTTQAQILDLITELRNKLAMGVLLITHDLDVVKKTADRVYVMRRGQIIEAGHSDSVLNRPKEEYTRQLIEAEPHRLTRSIPENAPVVLQGTEIQVWFPIKKGVLRKTVDHIKAADNVSLAIRAGETVGVVGESGSGKTSLALALLRLISSRGEIELHGHPLQALRQHRLKPLRRKMQVVFQDPYGSLSPRLTVSQIVAEGLVAHRIGTQTEREAQVIEALEGVGLDPAARHRYPHDFSGGQRQRIMVARPLMLDPPVIIADEPVPMVDELGSASCRERV